MGNSFLSWNYLIAEKKKTERYSQENYWGDLQLKSCGGGQIRNIRNKERKNGKRTRDNGKISQNKET